VVAAHRELLHLKARGAKEHPQEQDAAHHQSSAAMRDETIATRHASGHRR
jgi:hypothetical protein